MATHEVTAKTVLFVSHGDVLGQETAHSQQDTLTVTSVGVPACDRPMAGSTSLTVTSGVHCLQPRYEVSQILNIFSRGLATLYRRSRFFLSVGVYCPAPSEEPAPCGYEVSGAGYSPANGIYLPSGDAYVMGDYILTLLGDWPGRVIVSSDYEDVFYYESSPNNWETSAYYPAPTVTSTC